MGAAGDVPRAGDDARASADEEALAGLMRVFTLTGAPTGPRSRP